LYGQYKTILIVQGIRLRRCLFHEISLHLISTTAILLSAIAFVSSSVLTNGGSISIFAALSKGGGIGGIGQTVSTLFCNAYNHGYHLAYLYNIPYWARFTFGMNFA
jgi:hypothetical protein